MRNIFMIPNVIGPFLFPLCNYNRREVMPFSLVFPTLASPLSLLLSRVISLDWYLCVSKVLRSKCTCLLLLTMSKRATFYLIWTSKLRNWFGRSWNFINEIIWKLVKRNFWLDWIKENYSLQMLAVAALYFKRLLFIMKKYKEMIMSASCWDKWIKQKWKYKTDSPTYFCTDTV